MSNPTSFSIRTDISVTDTNVNGDLQVQGDSTYYGSVSLISFSANGPVFRLVNTNNDATSGEIEFFKDPIDGASTNGDSLGKITYDGLSSTSIKREYSRIEGVIGDQTNAAEDGQIVFSSIVAGTSTEVARTNPNAGSAAAAGTGAGGFGLRQPVIVLPVGAYTVDPTQSGSIFVASADGVTDITLPNASALNPEAVGCVYDFNIVIDQTGAFNIQTPVAGSQNLTGSIQMNTLAGTIGDSYGIGASFNCSVGPAASEHQYLANNDFKGRLAGTHLRFTCIQNSAGGGAHICWMVSGNAVIAGSAVATPFA